MKENELNKKEFFNFLKNNLANFLKENHLGVVTEYKDVVIKGTRNKNDQEVNYYSEEQLRNIYFGSEGVRFVKYLLSHANEEQKLSILKDKYNYFNYEHLIVANYRNHENLKLVFSNISKSVLKNNTWQNMVEEMQKDFSPENYDELIDIFLSDKVKEVKNKNNKIIMNLMLNPIKNDDIYNKYNSLIPNNEISDDFFENLKINCFDLNVSKDKLYSAISLKNKDKYNEMHNFLLEKLNDEKLTSKLDIISIDGEAKFKSSKYYRYIFRVKEEGLIDLNKAKMLIISVCKLYAHTLNNIGENEIEYKELQKISSEMIYNNYLQYRLEQESSNENRIKEKKFKI